MKNFENKLDRMMQRIWEESAKIRLPETPDTNDAWMQMEQLMDIQENESIQKTAIKSTVPVPFMKPRLVWAIAASLSIDIYFTHFCITLLQQHQLWLNAGNSRLLH